MTMKNTKIKSLLFTGLVMGLVSGCSTPSESPNPTEGSDYRQNHQIKVSREQISLSMRLPDKGLNLAPSDERRFRMFIRDFVQRGRTAITVESTTPELARAIMVKNGLRESEIILISNTTVLPPNAILSYTANKVEAPECGDWSSTSTFNYTNKPHSNFGCSIQRNIGKVVADPGDFLQAQPATGGAASRTDQVIRTHQSGAVKPRLMDGGGSTVK
ncbi:MAG: hypothetical protein COB59_05120 [Rhodospirillaceae bacterium]|nr:MAG: hypothetical protein COB59_05120 [Rhodospirillaceae bacterium]